MAEAKDRWAFTVGTIRFSSERARRAWRWTLAATRRRARDGWAMMGNLRGTGLPYKSKVRKGDPRRVGELGRYMRGRVMKSVVVRRGAVGRVGR